MGEGGITLLLAAVGTGNVDVVRLLLKTPGVDVNKATNNGITALHAAIKEVVIIVKIIFIR